MWLTLTTRLLIFLCFFCLITHNVIAQSKELTVLSVLDGDTLIVQFHQSGEEKYLHLLGIDAPEVEQNYGIEAAAQLLKMAKNRIGEAWCVKEDFEGTVWAQVTVNGKDLGESMVTSGYAWYEKELSDVTCTSYVYTLYEHLQLTAKTEREGLWQEKSPTRPKTFRKIKEEALKKSKPQTSTPPITNTATPIVVKP